MRKRRYGKRRTSFKRRRKARRGNPSMRIGWRM